MDDKFWIKLYVLKGIALITFIAAHCYVVDFVKMEPNGLLALNLCEGGILAYGLCTGLEAKFRKKYEEKEGAQD